MDRNCGFYRARWGVCRSEPTAGFNPFSHNPDGCRKPGNCSRSGVFAGITLRVGVTAVTALHGEGSPHLWNKLE